MKITKKILLIGALLLSLGTMAQASNWTVTHNDSKYTFSNNDGSNPLVIDRKTGEVTQDSQKIGVAVAYDGMVKITYDDNNSSPTFFGKDLKGELIETDGTDFTQSEHIEQNYTYFKGWDEYLANTDKVHSELINNNKDQILDNAESISENREDIDSNSNAISNNSSRIDSLRNRMDDMDDKIDKVGAMSSAMTHSINSMPLTEAGDVAIGAGIGAMGREQAIAISLGTLVTENLKVTTSVTTDGGADETMFGAGAGYKFNWKN